MKYLLILLLTACSLSVHANKPSILYKIEIYQATDADLIDEPVKTIAANSELLHSPSILADVGESASIEFGEADALLKLDVKSNKTGETYSFKISQKESSGEDWTSLTMATPNIVLGNGLALKAELQGQIYLFYISAEKAEQ